MLSSPDICSLDYCNACSLRVVYRTGRRPSLSEQLRPLWEVPIATHNGSVYVSVTYTGKRMHAEILPSVHQWRFQPHYNINEFNHEVDAILDRCNGPHPDLLRAAETGIQQIISYRMHRHQLTVTDNHCANCRGPIAEHADADLKCLFGTTSYTEGRLNEEDA